MEKVESNKVIFNYVRYDFSTASKLLAICKELKYGILTSLIKQAKNKKDLAKKPQDFKGIGPVTTRIFLRDLKLENKDI